MNKNQFKEQAFIMMKRYARIHPDTPLPHIAAPSFFREPSHPREDDNNFYRDLGRMAQRYLNTDTET